MSVLFFFASVLVLLYINTTSTITAAVLALATLAGMYLDGWSFLSILFGSSLLVAAYILVLPQVKTHMF